MESYNTFSFFVWHLLPRIVLRFLHVIAYINVIPICYWIVFYYMDTKEHCSLIHLLIDVLGCFQFRVIMNKVFVNTHKFPWHAQSFFKNFNHSDMCVMVSHCKFNFAFPNDWWHWASFHMLNCHLYIFLVKNNVQIFCPFLMDCLQSFENYVLWI